MEQELETVSKSLDIATEFIVNYGFQFLGAIIILVVGWQIAKWVSNLVLALCNRTSLDVTLSKFFANVAKTLVIIFVVIIAMGKFGITIAPFIAALGAVAFGSTLALQGPLSNYGAGLTIIMTRPFTVGDTIKIQGVTGIVEDIKLAYTQLVNEDSELITIPNKQIVGEIIHNTSAYLLVESSIAISYQDDPGIAIDLIEKILQQTEMVPDDPAALVGIENFGESGIILGVRYWLPTKKYFQIMYMINMEIYKKLKEAGITIPYPRQDVNIVGNS